MDSRALQLTQGTGVSRYARVLLDTIPLAGCEPELLSDEAPTHRPWQRLCRWAAAAVRPGAWPAPNTRAGSPRTHNCGDGFRAAQVRFDLYGRLLPLRTDAPPPDIMHWTYPVPMRLRGSHNIYCVHDIVPLLHPSLTPIDQGRLGRLLGRLRHEASHIVTVSEQSRQDILATLGWPPDRVTNTYQAVSVPGAPAAQVAARFGLLRDGYFLHVGSIEPRKNIARLIEAYRASGLTVPLVLAGPDGWRARNELAAARDMLAERPRASGSPCVVRIPWVDRDVLLGLMSEARAVVVVSLAEGFGLPIAEAMEIGVPVLTTESGACAEVAGGAALIVDPYDPRAIAAALCALDGNAGLRDQLRSKGHARASLFTPAAYADRLNRLYVAVLGQTSEVA